MHAYIGHKKLEKKKLPMMEKKVEKYIKIDISLLKYKLNNYNN